MITVDVLGVILYSYCPLARWGCCIKVPHKSSGRFWCVFRVKKLKETLATVQQLDKNMSNLRSWLCRIESELSRPITYSVCHHHEIQKRLAEHQVNCTCWSTELSVFLFFHLHIFFSHFIYCFHESLRVINNSSAAFCLNLGVVVSLKAPCPSCMFTVVGSYLCMCVSRSCSGTLSSTQRA